MKSTMNKHGNNRVCGDCVHFAACAAWNIGSIMSMDATHCVNYEQPTVDAVPVRCKDCKYCYAEGFVNVRNVCEKHYDFGNVDDDWFCADGERRSDEQ
jgi:hypothetical protein